MCLNGFNLGFSMLFVSWKMPEVNGILFKSSNFHSMKTCKFGRVLKLLSVVCSKNAEGKKENPFKKIKTGWQFYICFCYKGKINLIKR